MFPNLSNVNMKQLANEAVYTKTIHKFKELEDKIEIQDGTLQA